jgi:hypothetical protein
LVYKKPWRHALAFFVHINNEGNHNILKRLIALTIIAFLIGGIGSARAQHIVEKGDTMFKIAIQHQMELDDLIKLNPQHPNPNIIHIGDHIITRDGSQAHQIVEFARSLQDSTTYEYGGNDYTPPQINTDCSGWARMVYQKFGIYLPRVSRDQAKVGTPVKFADMQKGDLMFFSTRTDKVVTHTGIYMGDNFWISNLSTKQDVEILSTWGSWTQKYFIQARRVL